MIVLEKGIKIDPKLIVMEGLDTSGKSTHAKKLAEYLGVDKKVLMMSPTMFTRVKECMLINMKRGRITASEREIAYLDMKYRCMYRYIKTNFPMPGKENGDFFLLMNQYALDFVNRFGQKNDYLIMDRSFISCCVYSIAFGADEDYIYDRLKLWLNPSTIDKVFYFDVDLNLLFERKKSLIDDGIGDKMSVEHERRLMDIYGHVLKRNTYWKETVKLNVNDKTVSEVQRMIISEL